MWNMKYIVTPVVPGATGIVAEELEKYLDIPPGKQTLCKQQLTWKRRT
jgi:hypothetical protein